MCRRLIIAVSIILIPMLTNADGVAVHEVRSEAPAAGIRRVRIELPSSELVIRNGSTERILIHGEVRRPYGNEAERERAKAFIEDISIMIDSKASRAVIRRVYGPNASGYWQRRKQTDYTLTIELPTGTHVELHQSAGSIDLSGRFGDVDIGLRAGQIRIEMPQADIKEVFAKTKIGEVKTTMGDRVVTREGFFPGATHFYSDTGDGVIRATLHVGEIEIILR